MNRDSRWSAGIRRWVLVLPFLLGASGVAFGGAFLLSETIDPDVVSHPTGYTGTGGTLSITVCIDPSSPYAASMVTPVQNAIATWNALTPLSPNLVFGASNEIPASEIDFESAAVHEMGHCIGLNHPNLSTESGLSDPERNYTKTTTGADSAYDLDDGADNVIGSSDDLRDDDVNLHWFRKSNDNPFTIDSTIDSTTYSRNVADLPGGHSFSANADRTVGAALGFPDSEAVMQQGQSFDEAQRALGHDDVATLRYAMSGVDELAGTSDDYTITLTYGGMATGCDINVKFDNAETAFAVCKATLSSITTTHYAIIGANMFFSDASVTWFFSTANSTTTSTSVPTTTSTSTSTTTSTLPPPLCGPTPLPSGSCRLVTLPLKGSILLKDNADDTKDQVKWKWNKGAATDVADFKNPVGGSASYQFCLYDASANTQPLLAAAFLPGGTCGTKPCWKTTGSGFAMTNKAGTPQGITKVKFGAGIAGKAKVQVQAKGAPVPMPALNLTLPVIAQLLIDDGFTTECWQTTYGTALKNDGAQFKAKGP